MARRRGILHAIAQAQREEERRQKALLRAQTQQAREYERAQLAYQRAQITEEKERARLYLASRLAEVEFKNTELSEQVTQLERILLDTLSVDDYFDLDGLKEEPEITPFEAGTLGQAKPEPVWSSFELAPLTTLQKLVPGAKGRHEQQLKSAKERFEAAAAQHIQSEQERTEKLAEYQRRYDLYVHNLRKKAEAQNAEIDDLKQSYAAGKPEAVVSYCSLVLESSIYPDDFPRTSKVAYVPESKQLVIEYDLPSLESIPVVAAYKYAKAKDEVAETARPLAQRKALYSSVIAQTTLRTMHELFEADRPNHIETMIFNGYVESIDLGTGQQMRVCVVTVRTTRDVFAQLNLSKVEPSTCLKTLNASVSKSPAELAPVRPVLEFSMVDRRFIEEIDVLTGLDQRQNLMELSPSEFEALIANLFRKMGLETRVTQASRDGGVDCVAFDPRPIFGGKVVIQAKRYKHTVGVSAVRDLFGTVQNEGASKGILVTTSGYGKAAFEFAEGKPLELLSGSHLLHMLAEHAGIEAKIEVPTDWKDPQPDSAGS